MKNKFFIFCFLLLNFFNANAQGLFCDWAVNAGSESKDFGKTVVDASGNIYTAGVFEGNSFVTGSTVLTNTFSGFCGIAPCIGDLFILKRDLYGTILWAKSIGSGLMTDERITSIALDPAGNIYVVGVFGLGSPIIFGSDTVYGGGGGYNSFLAKYDPSGNVMWAKGLTGYGSNEVNDVATDPAGNVFLTGVFNSSTLNVGAIVLSNPAPGSDIFIAKYNSAGNVQWAKSTGYNRDDIGQSLATDAAGNVYLCGSFISASITLDAITLTNFDAGGTTKDAFIAKFDASGNVVWAQRAGEAYDDDGQDVVVDNSGNVLLIGNFYSYTITFGAVTLTNIGIPGTANDSYLVKYTASGTVLWAKKTSGVHPKSVCTDLNNNIFTTGWFEGTASVGPFPLNSYFASAQLYVAKYDSLGVPVWASSQYGQSDTHGTSISTDSTGGVYVTGDYGGSFFQCPGTGIYLANTGTAILADVFLLKMSTFSNDVWPGDANSNHIVDNTDLLPIGVYYGFTGPPRSVMGNVWQAYSATDWAATFGGLNMKHFDCNGDGILNSNDTVAINQNFSLTHAYAPSPVPNNLRAGLPQLYFVTSSLTYTAGQTVDVEVWLDTVNTMYGITFNINYNAALVQPGTETITYPNSFLKSSGNSMSVSKANPLINTAFGGIVRTSRTDTSGFGKIADFKFKLKSPLSTNDSMLLEITNYTAINSLGGIVSFDPIPTTIYISTGAGLDEISEAENTTVYPNPYFSFTTIHYAVVNRSMVSVEIYNAIGQKIETLVNSSQMEGDHYCRFSAREKGYKPGVYFVKITIDGKTSVKKIVEL